MTMFNEALLTSMVGLINKCYDKDAIKVVAYREVEKSDGYCETCYWEYTEIEIDYVTSTSDEVKTYTFGGDFGELIRKLTDNE